MGRRKEIKAVAIASNIFYFLNHIYRSINIFFTQNIRKELLLTKIIIGKLVIECTQDIDYKRNVDFNSKYDIITMKLHSSIYISPLYPEIYILSTFKHKYGQHAWHISKKNTNIQSKISVGVKSISTMSNCSKFKHFTCFNYVICKLLDLWMQENKMESE